MPLAPGEATALIPAPHMHTACPAQQPCAQRSLFTSNSSCAKTMESSGLWLQPSQSSRKANVPERNGLCHASFQGLHGCLAGQEPGPLNVSLLCPKSALFGAGTLLTPPLKMGNRLQW